jgi:hypothetical protein
VIEGCCQARIAVAARDDFGVWPDLETDLFEQAAIFICGATGKKDSRAIDLLWQFSENRAQTLRRGEPKIRRRQFSVVNDAKFRAGRIGYYEHPGCFCTAAFDAEDALTGFHNAMVSWFY